MDAIIVAIGDEVVAGQTINTNSAVIACALTQWGLNVQMQVALKDDLNQLEIGLPALLAQADILVLCGGLGPTTDDKTREALTQAFGWEMVLDDVWMNILIGRYKKPEVILKSQATKPMGSMTLFNKEGTACGFLKEAKKGKWIAAFPGVPQECRAMLDELYLHLNDLKIIQAAEERTVLHFIGVYERYLEHYLKQAVQQKHLKDLSWGLYPGIGVVQVVLKGGSSDREQAANVLRNEYTSKEYSGNILKDLSDLFGQQDLTVCLIESMTAGWIQYYLSRSPELKKYLFFGNSLDRQQNLVVEPLQLDDVNFKIIIKKQDDILIDYSLRLTGSIEMQQQKLGMATLGVIYEFLKNQSFQLVVEPIAQ